MKSIDFTKPSGFPLTQDQLGYMQTAYTECLNALVAIGGSGPFAISGCVVTKTLVSGTTFNYSVTAGWVYYNGSMIRVPATSLTGIDESVNAAYMLVTPTAAPLSFYNGSNPNVILDSSISLVAQVIGTADDSTHFLLSELIPFGVSFGNNNKESAWNTLIVNTAPADGGVTGNIYYKKNFLTNTLQLRGFLSANNAQNFAASPASLYPLMCTLPTGYWPANPSAFFMANKFFATQILDDTGIDYIRNVECSVNVAGQLLIRWIRPNISITGYSIEFNTIIPLD